MRSARPIEFGVLRTEGFAECFSREIAKRE
jgi:hypothetical protein